MADAATEATRAFLRFRQTGDPEAIARVFDLVAPKLLLLASHLTRDAATAEDLVQTTFLQAMERADSFDPALPSLLPWMSQILRRRAQDLHRRAARESRLLRGRGRPEAHDLDPQTLLENSEAAAELEQALESMPEKYRSVLILRLLHGMQPKDIGYALGIGGGTVRSQLKRGLDWLRQRMRQGVPLSIAVAMIATRGLAGVRRAVVARARERMPPPAWHARPLVRIAAVAGAAAIGLRVFAGGAAPPASAPGASGHPELAASALIDEHRDEFEPAGPARWRRIATEPAAGSSVAGRRLRVWFGDESTPARDILLILRPVSLSIDAPPLSLTTDESGTAPLALAAGTYNVQHFGFGKQFLTVPAGDGDVRLFLDPGVTVRGRVVDRAGGDAAGAEIWTSGSINPRGRIVATAGTDGAFECAHATYDQLFTARLPDGRWSDAVVLRDLEQQTVEVALTVPARTRRIHGRCRMPDGRPVTGAEVRVKSASEFAIHANVARLPHRAWLVTTGEDGRFELSLPAGDSPVVVRVDHPDLVPVARRLDARSLAEPVEAVLQPARRLRGRVTAADGTPVPNASVVVVDPQRVRRGTTTDLDGRYEVVSLALDRLTVIADAGPHGRTITTVEDGRRDTFDVVVVPGDGVTGRVRDAAGAPCVGLLVTPMLGGEPADRTVLTDAEGRFFLHRPEWGIRSVRLSVRTDVPPIAELDIAGHELDIVVPGTREELEARSYVNGTVTGADLEVRIERVGTSWARPALVTSGAPFRIGPLPAGEYDLVVLRGGQELERVPCRLRHREELRLGHLLVRSAGR